VIYGEHTPRRSRVTKHRRTPAWRQYGCGVRKVFRSPY
jgi:hypothetical protein